jgi:hypothetical protein
MNKKTQKVSGEKKFYLSMPRLLVITIVVLMLIVIMLPADTMFHTTPAINGANTPVTTPRPGWAVVGNYLNYSLYGISGAKNNTYNANITILHVYTSNGTVNASIVLIATNTTTGNTSVLDSSFHTSSWNNFLPFGLNDSMLKEINAGIVPSYMKNGSNVYSDKVSVPLTTPAGNFITDKLSNVTSSGTQKQILYFDQSSGIMVSFCNNDSKSNSPSSMVLNSTNVYSTAAYNATFRESGLPSGTNWSVVLNETTLSSTSNTITFTVTNGTYNYTSANFTMYYTTNYSGIVKVSGASTVEPVMFYHYAYITGTISPSNATMYINGKSVALSSSGAYNVSEPSGTYAIRVSDTGYKTYYTNVTVTANQTKSLNVPLTKPQTTSISPVEMYGVAIVAVAIAVVLLAWVIMRKKK